MKATVELIVRLLAAALNLFNRNKAKEYADDPATAIANSDDGVHKSDKTFAELASESERDRAK
ncbi:hypothetical protein TW81_02180 [Vibrio galatheae]|uniref:Uncharacterized protein n=1 Tax=Vibrio galatheae TaxID=579748 RepID=A0A0F4NNY1_9VIBR|nr:hypothetical protein [Vibrio galatheae]KJY84822.1 hypothetical protein TW81_02180 [Vibrio galatheae]